MLSKKCAHVNFRSNYYTFFENSLHEEHEKDIVSFFTDKSTYYKPDQKRFKNRKILISLEWEILSKLHFVQIKFESSLVHYNASQNYIFSFWSVT